MSTDRPPTDGPAAGEAPWPAPAEPTLAIPNAEATQPIRPVEPTLAIQPDPTRAIQPEQTRPPDGSWASGPGEWPAPDPAQAWRPQASGGTWQPDPPGHPASQPYPGPQQPYFHPYGGNQQPFQPTGQQAGWQHVSQPVQPHAAPGLGQPEWAPPGTGQPPGWGAPPGPPAHWAAAPPPPLAGYPQQVTPPPRGGGWLIALMTLAAVVVVSLIAALAVPVLTELPQRRDAPTAVPTSKVTPTPSSPSPEPKPTPTMPTDSKVLLKKNPIYRLKVPAKCGYQSIPASEAAFRKQVRSLVDCQNSAWKKALSATPVKFTKPKVKFYSSSTKTPCGKLGTTFPASYCSGDSTIYYSRAAYLQGRYYRLSVAHFVMHEYAHHVQSIAGILGSTWVMKESAAVTSRRVELQAHCIAHYELTVSGVGYGARDHQSIQYQWDYTNDPKGHGSTKAERYWGERGLDATNLGSCNTWTAKAARVR